MRSLALVVLALMLSACAGKKEEALALEVKLRAELPLGTARAEVLKVLAGRGMEAADEATCQCLRAIAKDLGGGHAFVSESLLMQFRFDSGGKLVSILARTGYAAP